MSLRDMCILGVNRVWSGVPYSGLIQVKTHSVGYEDITKGKCELYKRKIIWGSVL